MSLDPVPNAFWESASGSKLVNGFKFIGGLLLVQPKTGVVMPEVYLGVDPQLANSMKANGGLIDIVLASWSLSPEKAPIGNRASDIDAMIKEMSGGDSPLSGQVRVTSI